MNDSERCLHQMIKSPKPQEVIKRKCSFCGKSHKEADVLFKEKNVYICSDCISLAVKALASVVAERGCQVKELKKLIHMHEIGG